MSPRITRVQLISTTQLIKSLEDLVDRNIIVLKNVVICYNPQTPDMVYVKYEKSGRNADDFGFEFKLMQIDKFGYKESIEKKFENVFATSAFLSMCYPIDMSKIEQYVID